MPVTQVYFTLFFFTQKKYIKRIETTRENSFVTNQISAGYLVARIHVFESIQKLMAFSATMRNVDKFPSLFNVTIVIIWITSKLNARFQRERLVRPTNFTGDLVLLESRARSKWRRERHVAPSLFTIPKEQKTDFHYSIHGAFLISEGGEVISTCSLWFRTESSTSTTTTTRHLDAPHD